MSRRVLSEVLFHGTAAPLKTGDKILPSNAGGAASNWTDTGGHRGQRSDEHAFATTAEHHAWYFAQTAAHNGDGYYGERPRVYTVAPHKDMRPGIHTELDEYIAPHFKVRERIDIQPGQQGTLNGNGPEPFNWTPFHKLQQPGQANHPQLGTPHTPTSHNAEAKQRQEGVMLKLRGKEEIPGQGELFPATRTALFEDSSAQARRHLVRAVVNDGEAPAYVPDHELARDEAMDNWNRRKGRRTNFARRDR